jgi:glycosyltransferase involved in cell wall biosynthesis
LKEKGTKYMYAPVSVIIPCYRCKDTIVRAIESISNQTLIPTEVILVEDCSGDSTLDFLYSIKHKYDDDWIKILSLKKNSGPATARNKGWESVTQKYIAFLDSDDSWHPKKIETQYSWMSSNEAVVMTAHATELYDESVVQTDFNGTFNKVSFAEMLISNAIPTRAVMLKTNISLRFSDGKRFAEDYLLWMLIINKYSEVYFLDVPLAFTYKNDLDDGGLTSNLWQMHCALLDTYNILFNNKCISFFTLITVYGINYCKLPIRAFKKFYLSIKSSSY